MKKPPAMSVADFSREYKKESYSLIPMPIKVVGHMGVDFISYCLSKVVPVLEFFFPSLVEIRYYFYNRESFNPFGLLFFTIVNIAMSIASFALAISSESLPFVALFFISSGANALVGIAGFAIQLFNASKAIFKFLVKPASKALLNKYKATEQKLLEKENSK